MNFNDLDARSVRERVDMVQIWQAWSDAESLRQHSFAGFLDWEERNGKEYLYSRKRGVVKSLGPRTPETERIREAFHTGRDENKKRLSRLAEEMDKQAAILRTLDAGRLPPLAAKVLRAIHISAQNSTMRVIGTNALYAYEAMAGIAFNAASTATGDIDLLVDDRNKLKILADDNERIGLSALIQRDVDKTFRLRGPRDFRLTNDDGYMVEFVRPEPRPIYREMPGAAPLVEGDIEPAPIVGLHWLVNVPVVETVVIDARGYPAPMRVPDPRFWAAHKLWLSQREDRDSSKKVRDVQQAKILLDVISSKLQHLAFDDEFRKVLPGALWPLLKEELERRPNQMGTKPGW